MRLFPLSASSTATINPVIADQMVAVAVKIAGIVMAVSTAYGI